MFISFICGYVAGNLQKGIHVNINHNQQPEAPTEYNESLANMLPADVQQYYKSTNGQNNF
jgi:hypothetical protein